MNTDLASSRALAADARSLDNLKWQAGQKTPAAIREAAKQFESMFMRELIKSMREATMKSGMLDSPQGDLGADLLDQQLAVQMSGQPGGLSDLIAQQLARQMGVRDPSAPAAPGQTNEAPVPSQPLSAAPAVATTAASSRQSSFVQQHTAAAAQVARSSGIPASFMIGQAGHESGWGQREINHQDGSPSFNLFGIKATDGWKGKVAEVTTTEYVDGVARKQVARFRAYDSYADSFRDYARLISDSPRYAQVRGQTDSPQAFASGLQRAGYATDPDYANKLSRAINTTLQLQRAQT
jgi:flagellar protein FlgJ